VQISDKKYSIIQNRKQLLVGILFLLLGSLIYVTDRDPAYVYFTRLFGIHLKLSGHGTNFLGAFGLRLPTFFHVFSFSLITASLISMNKKKYFAVCTGWFLMNCCLEMGQKFKQAATGVTPDFFDHFLFFENTRAYFLKGTFDWLDIVAAATGAIFAYLTLLSMGKNHFKFSSKV